MGTKWYFVHTPGTQVVFRPLCSVSRRHFCKWSENVDCGEPTENTCTQGRGAHFSARVQGHRHRARFLARILKKKVYSHYCPASTVLGYQCPGTKCERTLSALTQVSHLVPEYDPRWILMRTHLFKSTHAPGTLD